MGDEGGGDNIFHRAQCTSAPRPPCSWDCLCPALLPHGCARPSWATAIDPLPRGVGRCAHGMACQPCKAWSRQAWLIVSDGVQPRGATACFRVPQQFARDLRRHSPLGKPVYLCPSPAAAGASTVRVVRHAIGLMRNTPGAAIHVTAGEHAAGCGPCGASGRFLHLRLQVMDRRRSRARLAPLLRGSRRFIHSPTTDA